MKRHLLSKKLTSCDFEHLGVVPAPQPPDIQMYGLLADEAKGFFSESLMSVECVIFRNHMASSFSPRHSKPKIFIATILAVVVSGVGAYAQRASAPAHKRAETTYIIDANGNRAGPGPHSELN